MLVVLPLVQFCHLLDLLLCCPAPLSPGVPPTPGEAIPLFEVNWFLQVSVESGLFFALGFHDCEWGFARSTLLALCCVSLRLVLALWPLRLSGEHPVRPLRPPEFSPLILFSPDSLL